jgi:RNase P/RNase MRP subunit POP5
MLVYILFAVFSCILIWKCRPAKRSGFVIEQSVEEFATGVMANIDGDDLVEEEDEPEFYNPVRKQGRFVAKVVTMAKANFGSCVKSEANRLMVRKFMLDLMRERGMRCTHITQHLDICVALFFVPSNAQIVAAQIASTREAITRTTLVSAVWESFYGLFKPGEGSKQD